MTVHIWPPPSDCSGTPGECVVTDIILSDQLGQPRENKDALPRHIQLTLGEYCGSKMVVPTSHSVLAGRSMHPET